MLFQKLFPPVQTSLHRARTPRILEHPCALWLWDVPEIQILQHSFARLGPWQFFSPFLDLHAESELCLLVGNVGSRDLHRQRILLWEITDLALACGSESVMDIVCAAAVGSARTGRELDAGSAREDRSSDVCDVGDPRWSFSEKI